MKQVVCILLFSLALAFPCNAGAAGPEKDATAAAERWLQLTDSGAAGESWEQASALFKGAVTEKYWEGTLARVRVPLGRTLTRTLESAAYTRSLPGVPDGEYVVIRFKTSFANKAEAVETVTPQKDKDGVWRVSGYFIQ